LYAHRVWSRRLVRSLGTPLGWYVDVENSYCEFSTAVVSYIYPLAHIR